MRRHARSTRIATPFVVGAIGLLLCPATAHGQLTTRASVDTAGGDPNHDS